MRGFLLMFRSKGNIIFFESKLLSSMLCLFKENTCVSRFSMDNSKIDLR